MLPSNLKNDEYYEDLFHLRGIIDSQVIRENVYTELRLIDLLLDCYHNHSWEIDVARGLLSKVIISYSSLIEVVLRMGLIKYAQSHDGNLVFTINNLSYLELIDWAIDRLKIVKISPDDLHLMRKLRNNIHLDRMPVAIEEIEYYDIAIVNALESIFASVIADLNYHIND